MKIKELMKLMIGDILMAYHDDGETQHNFPVIIDGLDNNGTLVDGESYVSWKPMLKEDDHEEYADELTPIPITAEILKRNGFEKVGSYEWQPRIKVTRWRFYSDSLEDMVEILYAPKYDGFTWKGCDVNSVHLLQHALRLCGLTDLADNLKV